MERRYLKMPDKSNASRHLFRLVCDDGDARPARVSCWQSSAPMTSHLKGWRSRRKGWTHKAEKRSNFGPGGGMPFGKWSEQESHSPARKRSAHGSAQGWLLQVCCKAQTATRPLDFSFGGTACGAPSRRMSRRSQRTSACLHVSDLADSLVLPGFFWLVCASRGVFA